MSRKPSFIVVTLLVVTLSVVAITAKLLQPLIPPGKPNRLSTESGEYLLQASTQAIDWRPFEDAAFSDARRLDKPVLLVIGSPWSQLGREVDRTAFSYGELQTYLNRNFICVRVDSFERPDWQVAFFPVSRITEGLFRTGFQAWVLDTKGRPFAFVGKTRPDITLDGPSVLGTLIAARRLFDQRQREGIAASDFVDKQQAELRVIEQGPPSSPDFAGHLSSLPTGDPGGFPAWGVQELLPNAWRYQLYFGRTSEFLSSARPFMLSPTVDLLDGGFFLASQTPDWKAVDFDKLATLQAETMYSLAIGGSRTGDKLSTWLAQHAFDSLAGEFVVQGMIAGCRVGDEEGFNRSRRSSFSVRRLEQTMTSSDDRKWAETKLGLSSALNPRLAPYLTESSLPFDEAARLNAVLGQLSKQEDVRSYAGVRLLDVNGVVTARLIETARLWRDPARLRTALDLFERLEAFRSGDSVSHGLTGRAGNDAFLTDYLAYSDAALQAYLATGRSTVLEGGLEVLTRARFLFAGDSPGEFLVSQDPGNTLLPPMTHVPEIGDTVAESTTARMIRLCGSYGRLLLESKARKGSRRDSGLSLLQTAYAGIGRFAAVANAAGPRVSGYFCAAAGLLDGAYAVAVGPQRQELADALASRVPARLIAPASDLARPDVLGREAGIYVFSGESVLGPLSVEDAAKKLGPRLMAGH